MSLFTRARRDFVGATAQDLIPPRVGVGASPQVPVTNDTALRNSAVWACLRLRADLVSSFPVDVFRMVGGQQIEVSRPPILTAPGGERWDYPDWMYASNIDLDRAGNAIGLITGWNGYGLPSGIELQPISACSIVERRDVGLRYRIDGKMYDPQQVWHERQYLAAGLPVGLSPVAYAAWTIGQYESAAAFARDWYNSGGIPKAHLRNVTQPIVDADVALATKARFKAAVQGNDVFVTGKDWEYKPVQAEAVGAEWLEAQKFGIGDIARFFGCPGDLIDAAVSSNNITYANVTQRNLQFLIMHLGPAVSRREKNLSKLIPQPQFVKLNTDALLRMDPEHRAITMSNRIASKTLTVTEARAYENLPPLTAEQIAEFVTLFGPPKALTPPSMPAPVPAKPAKSGGLVASIKGAFT